MKKPKSLTPKEIAYADWERHYKDKGISFEEASQVVWNLREAGAKLSRSGNTLFIIMPEDDMKVVRFHTITADKMDAYLSALEKFFVMLGASHHTELAHTYIEDKKIFDAAQKKLGDVVSIEENFESPEKGKFSVFVDIQKLMTNLFKKAKKEI